jgi:hypothetical protein
MEAKVIMATAEEARHEVETAKIASQLLNASVIIAAAYIHSTITEDEYKSLAGKLHAKAITLDMKGRID